MDERTQHYAESLARLIRLETVSGPDTSGDAKFSAFRRLLRESFPDLFARAEYTDFTDSFALRWAGSDPGLEPDLFMNHHDVVEAGGAWRYPPFSGEIAEGRLWGRGTLDNKGGLWAMLQAADELAREGFVPRRTTGSSPRRRRRALAAARTRPPAGLRPRASASGLCWTRAASSSTSRSGAQRAALP